MVCMASLFVSDNPPWKNGQTLTFTVSSNCQINSWTLITPTNRINANGSDPITYTVPNNVYRRNSFSALVNVTENNNTYNINSNGIVGYFIQDPHNIPQIYHPNCQITDLTLSTYQTNSGNPITAYVTITCENEHPFSHNNGVAILCNGFEPGHEVLCNQETQINSNTYQYSCTFNNESDPKSLLNSGNYNVYAIFYYKYTPEKSVSLTIS